ncbi:GGDEF domain-containing protein [Butyrivibrio fibrisolvens]|uniref:GGDEF domain-containing protein n=1 Tax=Butyrivibrio fibrisolvens TaxID=831 RepID=UPI000429445B|nr:GGDEF domain-containing protein [Butyrivibrio fibrisolvens]
MVDIPIEVQLRPFILLLLILSIVNMVILFNKTNENIGNKREVRAFRGMLLSFMLYALIDLRLVMGDSFYRTFPKFFILFTTSLGMMAMTLSCFFWFLHVYYGHNVLTKHRTKRQIIIDGLILHIPLFICLILLFTPLNRFLFEFRDFKLISKPTVLFILSMDYIYLIAATIISLRQWKRASTKTDKKKYAMQVVFIIFFTISGGIIGMMMDLPAIEVCMLPVVLKLFVELQDSQIYTDALTKLNNRRRITEFINEELINCSIQEPLSVIMVDMDFFKSINDTLGHDEGDKALIVLSKALKKVVAPQNALAGRWGGDEFVIAGKAPGLIDGFKEALTGELSNISDLGYDLYFSIGTFKCTSNDLTYEEVLAKADEALYTKKNKRTMTASEYVKKLLESKEG